MAERTRYDARAWTPSASPPSRPRASRCRRASKASAGSPTTCTGPGTRRRATCGASSTGRRGRAIATRSRSSAARPSGRACSTTRSSWPSTTTRSRRFDQYMADGSDHWFPRRYGGALDGPIAYFCAEYGFHESLGIYSGGLGVLAGDHMKTASDMALPRDRRRAALSQGLLPPVDRRRRPPGAQLPRLRPQPAAAQPRSRMPRGSR